MINPKIEAGASLGYSALDEITYDLAVRCDGWIRK